MIRLRRPSGRTYCLRLRGGGSPRVPARRSRGEVTREGDRAARQRRRTLRRLRVEPEFHARRTFSRPRHHRRARVKISFTKIPSRRATKAQRYKLPLASASGLRWKQNFLLALAKAF